MEKFRIVCTYFGSAFSTGAHLPELMFQAMELVPNMSAARFAFYMSRTIRTRVRQQTAAATHLSTLTTEMVGGKLVEKFHGIPLRRVDALAADETAVT